MLTFYHACNVCSPTQVLTLAFSSDGAQLLAAGDKFFKLFALQGGSSMPSRAGLFGSSAKVQRILVAASLGVSQGFIMAGASGALLRLEPGSRKVRYTQKEAVSLVLIVLKGQYIAGNM